MAGEDIYKWSSQPHGQYLLSHSVCFSPETVNSGRADETEGTGETDSTKETSLP